MLLPDTLASVVGCFGVDVVPVGHLALRRVQHGGYPKALQHPQAHRRRTASLWAWH